MRGILFLLPALLAILPMTINIFLLVLGLYLIYRFATHKKLIRRWESFVEGDGLVGAIVTEESPLVSRPGRIEAD